MDVEVLQELFCEFFTRDELNREMTHFVGHTLWPELPPHEGRSLRDYAFELAMWLRARRLVGSELRDRLAQARPQGASRIRATFDTLAPEGAETATGDEGREAAQTVSDHVENATRLPSPRARRLLEGLAEPELIIEQATELVEAGETWVGDALRSNSHIELAHLFGRPAGISGASLVALVSCVLDGPPLPPDVLVAMLGALDAHAMGHPRREPLTEAIEQQLLAAERLVVHVEWQEDCKDARELAEAIYERLVRGGEPFATSGPRIPVYLYEQPGWDLDVESVSPGGFALVVSLQDGRYRTDARWIAHEGRMSQHDGLHRVVVDIGRAPEQPDRTLRLSHDPEAPPEEILTKLLVILFSALHLGVGEPRPPRFFLSYRHARPDALPSSPAQRLVDRLTAGLRAYPIDVIVDTSVLRGGDDLEQLLEHLEDAALIALRTDDYVESRWVRWEALRARQLGRPIVVAVATGTRPGRLAAYLDDAPTVHVDDPHFVARLAEAGMFALVRHVYQQRMLQDVRRTELRDEEVVVLSSAPDFVRILHLQADHVANGGGRRLLLHPEPPLPVPERSLLEASNPSLALVTASSLGGVAGSGTADRPRIRVGLSASEPLTFRQGLTRRHVEDAFSDVVRTLLLNHAELHFGGHLREGSFTQAMIDLTREYGPTGVRVVHVHLAWPIHLHAKDVERRDRLSRLATFTSYEAPKSRLPFDVRTHVSPDTPEHRYLWSRSLTHMRRRLVHPRKLDALIVLGGKTSGYLGRYPGVAAGGRSRQRAQPRGEPPPGANTFDAGDPLSVDQGSDEEVPPRGLSARS
ncbi:MAG: hypothetical protein KTR31_22270, partial [Myxococcales bacterium]|nr:hypothetical protein [Myxococcales bacterium]